ncbi:PDR/VanB family oxidoreductase [Aquabacterium sp. J223]|uniref:PDR/VanB family oxidoreductase n=1 Tax=Aquabacterium sp. J223 TaxID=2898431 RepID=UPI0021ADF099|nr:PDR/VanB family oxidoreductase [Aquabacterium sp. J223]UUX94575.1 PDR/VanB family oxidoreductase [Aquabacterium sp. J223]
MTNETTSLLTVRVARKTVEAEGIAGFELVAADGSELPAFDAGAHIDVHAPGGLLRQYSLCNPPGERHRYLIGVLRDPASRGGSVAMHDGLKEGDTLQISAPKNHFPLVEDAPRSLLFAGGIGVTPILAMAERLHALGRDFTFHYACRSPARTAFTERIRASGFADKVLFHHDDGAAEQKLDLPSALKSPAAGTHLYVCGPKGFLEAVRAQAADAGWPEANVHYEYFAGVEAHSAADRHFDVVIKSSGAVIRVEAAQTVVQALEANGVFVPVSCEQGVCGTCLTRVLEGEVEHKDLYLTPEEQAANDQFLPCCSRAKSERLVLDL